MLNVSMSECLTEWMQDPILSVCTFSFVQLFATWTFKVTPYIFSFNFHIPMIHSISSEQLLFVCTHFCASKQPCCAVPVPRIHSLCCWLFMMPRIIKFMQFFSLSLFFMFLYQFLFQNLLSRLNFRQNLAQSRSQNRTLTRMIKEIRHSSCGNANAYMQCSSGVGGGGALVGSGKQHTLILPY